MPVAKKQQQQKSQRKKLNAKACGHFYSFLFLKDETTQIPELNEKWLL